MGTPILGTIVAAKITTGNTDNTFATGDANEIQGGHHTVASLAERDAITTERRAEGMSCWVVSSGTSAALYRLIGGITNGNWIQEFTSSPPLSTLPDVNIPTPTAQQVLAFDGSRWIASDAPSTTSPSAFTYYLDDAMSGTAGYHSLTAIPAGGTEVSDSIVITSGSGLAEFDHAYLGTYLNRTRIDAGIWEFNVYGSVDTGSANFQAAFLTRSASGTETELFRIATAELNSTVPVLITTVTTQGSYASDLFNKPLIKFYGTTTGTSPVTLSLYHNGTSHYTHIHTPLGLSHNDLGGLQGGASDEYYHITLQQSGALIGTLGTPGLTNPYATYQTTAAEQGTRSQADQNLQNQVDQALQLASGAGSIKAVVNGGITGQTVVGSTVAGTVTLHSLTAGPGITLTNGTNTVIVSAGTAAEYTYSEGLALEVFQDYAPGTLPTLDKGIGWDGPAFAVGHSIGYRAGVNGRVFPRLIMAQGEYARKFAWGNAWYKVRVFIGLNMTGTTTFNPGLMLLGVGSGTLNTWTKPTTANFIGGGIDSPATFLLNPEAMYNFTFQPFESKRGATRTGYGSGVGSAGRSFSANGTNVSLYIAEIIRTKGTASYTISVQEPTTVSANYSMDYAPVAQSGALSVISAAPWGNSAGVTQTFDESTGPLDGIDFIWTGATPIEIAYLGATRLY